MRESVIEDYLIRRVRQLGGWTSKWVSPACSGLPDRIVILNGHTVFVETKAPGKKARELQKMTFDDIRECGGHVYVAATQAEVDEVLSELSSANV